MLCLALAACSGSGPADNTPVLPDTQTSLLLPTGAGAIFPAGSFTGATEVTVTAELLDAQRDIVGFPPNAGTLLGATRIEVPAGVELAQNITVLIALGQPVSTGVQFTIFSFNDTTRMWESTASASTSALHSTCAQGQVSQGNIVAFTAPTAGTTGLKTAYGVFTGYQGPASINQIPLLELAATSQSVNPGVTVTITASGNDPDGDALTFTWLVSGGELQTPVYAANTSCAAWSAGSAGVYTIVVSCADGRGGVDTEMLAITVGVMGDAPVWLEQGQPPAALHGDVQAPFATQQILLSGTVTDPNGDDVAVIWSDDTGVAGNFTSASFDRTTGEASVYWANAAAGEHTVTATADDRHGNITAASVVIMLNELPASYSVAGYETCNNCHAALTASWLGTSHAHALETSIIPHPHGFRNESCYRCHGAGIWPAGTGGFIDPQLTPQFANIQCESCHGGGASPGSGAGHKPLPWDPGKGFTADTAGRYVTDDTGAYVIDAAYDGRLGYGCGLCHTGARYGAFDEWNTSRHATYPLTETEAGVPVAGPAGKSGCVECHNGQYFVSVQINGAAPPDADLAVDELVPYAMHINCATCHDVHATHNEMQLRVGSTAAVSMPWDGTAVGGGWGNICLKCHNGKQTHDDYLQRVQEPGLAQHGPHQNAQGALLFGLMGADFAGAPVAYVTGHAHASMTTDSCVACHMYRRDYVDAANPATTGHNWRPQVENCLGCHTGYTADQADEFWAWVAQFQTEAVHSRLDAFVDSWPAAWQDASDPAAPLLRNMESTPGAGDGPPAAADGDAYRELLWNYELVLADGSRGVHNPAFTLSLLDESIARLQELTAP